MAIDLRSIGRTCPKPPRIVLYGTHGIGKTSLAMSAPGAILLPTEDGWGTMEVDAFPLAKSLDDVLDCIGALIDGDHQYKTLVIDSIDWMEPHVLDVVCKAHGKKNIEEIGYGKGYVMASDIWRNVLAGLNRLRDMGMVIIAIAHEQVTRFEDPQSEPYDRYTMKLNKRGAALWEEWADAVLFYQWERDVVVTGKAMDGNNKHRAKSTGTRVIQTVEEASFRAKNRYGMPPAIRLEGHPGESWDLLEKHLKGDVK